MRHATRGTAPAPVGSQALDRKAAAEIAPRPLEGTEQRALVAQLEEAICSVSGLKTKEVAMQLVQVLANIQPWHRPENTAAALSMAISTLAELRPRTFVEAMLAVQMVGAFQAGTHLLSSALLAGQQLEQAEWKMKNATRLMRLFTEQLDALASLKGQRGRQKVTVRHVHVHPGGQAIVGTVTAPRHRRLPAAQESRVANEVSK